MEKVIKSLRIYGFSAVIFLLGILITLLIGNYSLIFVNKLSTTKLDDKAVVIKNLISNRIDSYIGALYGVKALYNSSDEVTQNEFYTFIKEEKIFERYPGIFSTSYIERVSLKNKEKFVDSVRNDTSATSSGYPNFKIFPERIDSEYYVVKNIAPFEGREKAFGFDYRSDPERKKVAEQARDMNLPQLSQSLNSLNTNNKIIVVLIPVYEKNSVLNTVEQRRKHLMGFTYSVLNISDLFSNLLNENQDLKKIDWELYEAPNKLFFDADKKTSLFSSYKKNRFVKKLEFKVNGNQWVLYLEDKSGGLTVYEKNIPLIIFSTGFIFSFLLFLVLISFTTARSRAQTIAEEMTKAFRENEDKFQAISAATGDAIIIMNNKDEVSFWNKAAEKMFGYLEEEVIGKKLHPLITFDVDYKKYEQDINKFQKSGESFVIGKPLNLMVKKKDGTHFPIEITISSIKIKDKWHAVGIIRDITERNKIEEEKKLHTQELERMNHLMVDRELKMVELKKKLHEKSIT